jgi:rod shape-determining protein MreD
MTVHNHIAIIYYLITIGIAMVLRVMSLNPEINAFNPDWIALVLIYWSMALPERFGVFTAWSVGLFTDVLTGRLIGQYALIYSVICYLSIKEHRRLRQFPMLQQCLFVFFMLMISHCIILGTESMRANNHLTLSFWYPVLSGSLLWPAVFWILRYIRIMARLA